MCSHEQSAKRVADELSAVGSRSFATGRVPQVIRSVIVLILFSHVALVGSSIAAKQAGTSNSAIAVRADHMVLDLVTHHDELLVGTQSGRVDVYDLATGDLREPIFVEPAVATGGFAPTIRSLDVAPIQKLLFIDEGRVLVSAGHDARVFVWNLAHESDQNSQER